MKERKVPNEDTAAWSASGSSDLFVPPAFSAHVSGPCLELGQRIFPLELGENLVGRSADAAVRLDSASVSRRHARLTMTAAGATIEDLGSRNGTMVGDARIRHTIAIHDGDAIRIGTVWLLYREGDREND